MPRAPCGAKGLRLEGFAFTRPATIMNTNTSRCTAVIAAGGQEGRVRIGYWLVIHKPSNT